VQSPMQVGRPLFGPPSSSFPPSSKREVAARRRSKRASEQLPNRNATLHY